VKRRKSGKCSAAAVNLGKFFDRVNHGILIAPFADAVHFLHLICVLKKAEGLSAVLLN